MINFYLTPILVAIFLLLSGCTSIFYHPTKNFIVTPADLNLEYHEQIIERD